MISFKASGGKIMPIIMYIHLDFAKGLPKGLPYVLTFSYLSSFSEQILNEFAVLGFVLQIFCILRDWKMP